MTYSEASKPASRRPILCNRNVTLLSNAIEYTKGGEVTIDATVTELDGSARCWVRDTGAGIPPVRIGKIFDKLETDPEKTGLGLGLAIVKQILEAHDGKVTVTSKVGQGSTFELLLPGPRQSEKTA